MDNKKFDNYKTKTKIFEKKINYIICDDIGYFDCNGSTEDLCVLYAFVTYKFLKNYNIDIKYLICSIINAYNLYKDIK